MSGTKEWAYREATRRARELDGPYSIYTNLTDYIIRTTEAAPPHGDLWRRVATIQPDGTQSFKLEDYSP